MVDYNELVTLLKKNVVTVTFKKVDGTTRVMACTLQNSYLPEQYQLNDTASMITEGDGEHETLSVWDVQASDWRSFRVSSVVGYGVGA